MARPKSDEKREAILEAAATLIAERGLSATPTSAISRAAGVGEGTLFTYFPSKTELINALYLAIKQEIATAMVHGRALPQETRPLLEHMWHAFIQWGVQRPAQRKAMQQLQSSGLLTAESLAEGGAAFVPAEQALAEAQRAGVFGDLSGEMVYAALNAMGEATMLLVAQHGPRSSAKIRTQGFAMLWRAITPE